MSTQTSTLDKLHLLESLYRQGYQSDVVDLTLDKILSMENAQMRQELNLIEVHLLAFEKQYLMFSADFYRRFREGELGDGADFFEWSAYYDMAQSLSQRMKTMDRMAA